MRVCVCVCDDLDTGGKILVISMIPCSPLMLVNDLLCDTVFLPFWMTPMVDQGMHSL